MGGDAEDPLPLLPSSLNKLCVALAYFLASGLNLDLATFASNILGGRLEQQLLISLASRER